MLEIHFSSGSKFDEYRAQLSSWLRLNMLSVISLKKEDVARYSHKNIIAGWCAEDPKTHRKFYLLLKNTFPFSKVQIAWEGKDKYLQWPHIEEHGFLCLKEEGWQPIENIENSILETLKNANELIDACSKSNDFIKSESAWEFLSYWNRKAEVEVGAKILILSLIDINNTTTRAIACNTSGNYFLVGESDKQLSNWINHSKQGCKNDHIQGIFGYINTKPSLPLPNTTEQLISTIIAQCDSIDKFIERLDPHKNTLFVFGIKTTDGIGLISVQINAISKKGFRIMSPANKKKPKTSRFNIKKAWKRFGSFNFLGIKRIDGQWIHGRDMSEDYRALASSKVVMLGVGSLGSQVACQLAQSGVGQLTLIDPQELDSANVGRHALGMDSFKKSKADQLAEVLSKKYPHGSYYGLGLMSWQTAFSEHFSIFRDANLIISCIGEPDIDLAWDECYKTNDLKAPLIYGWIGTQGTVGHTLAITSTDPGLSCILDEMGFNRKPDTHFQNGSKIKFEPGCGTYFQPYSSISVGCVERLVSRMAIDILSDRTSTPIHRIYTCSTQDLIDVGGEWTEDHKLIRPQNYNGPLEYSKEVTKCGECHRCCQK